LEATQSNVSISIIIPVYNEEKRLKSCKERLLSYCKEKGWDFELIFVQDNSIDSTPAILKEFCKTDNAIKAVNIPMRVGKGGAIIYSTLVSPTKEYVAFMDVDLSADPSELERLIEYIEDYDIVMGSRILRGNLLPIKRPLYRSFLSHSYSRLFRILFKVPISDPQCGFKLFRKEIISKLFEDINVMGFAFDTDVVVSAFSQGLRIKETPINWIHGKCSRLSVRTEIHSMGIDLLSIWYRSHQSRLQANTQSKYNIFERLLFVLISLDTRIKDRHLDNLERKSLLSNLIKNEMHVSKSVIA
jgi:glycosyltransferase involved in cell wall biosynthesis